MNKKIILSLYIPCHYEHHPGFCLLLPYIARHIYECLTADSGPVCSGGAELILILVHFLIELEMQFSHFNNGGLVHYELLGDFFVSFNS